MSEMNFTSLVDRIAQVSEPDHALSETIYLACGWQRVQHQELAGNWFWHDQSGLKVFHCADLHDHDPLRSIDAAEMLVPQGWSWSVGEFPGHKPEAILTFKGSRTWTTPEHEFIATHSTPAVAMCIAVLRAHEVLARAAA